MWTCPLCATAIEPSFEVCWNCGSSPQGVPDPTFRRADEAPPIVDEPPSAADDFDAAPLGSGELVEAYRALDLMEAAFLADQLGQRGIAAKADEQDMHDALGGMTSGPRVYVLESDLPRARAWLATYERDKHGPHAP